MPIRSHAQQDEIKAGKFVRRHGKKLSGRPALALAAISVYKFLGVDPPESAMVKRPRALTASVAVRITSSAAAWNRSCGVVRRRSSVVELTKFPLARSSMWPRTGPPPADRPYRW